MYLGRHLTPVIVTFSTSPAVSCGSPGDSTRATRQSRSRPRGMRVDERLHDLERLTSRLGLSLRENLERCLDVALLHWQEDDRNGMEALNVRSGP